MPSRSPRVLLADDQRDILEALQLLLEERGFPGAVRHVAGGRAGGDRRSRLRCRADRSQLRARHDVRAGRARPAGAAARPGSDASGHRAHRVGERRCRGRGDAPRRARFRAEAVGQRAAARHRPDAGRAEPRTAARAPARRRRPPELRRRASADCALAGDEAGHRAHRADGAVRRQRADHRRERHRQGARRSGDPRAVAASGAGRW